MFSIIPLVMSIYFVYMCVKDREEQWITTKRNKHHQFGKLLARKKRQTVVR